MPCDCNIPDQIQPFPTTGPLAQNRNPVLSSTKNNLHDSQDVYFYVVATIENKAGTFIQTGCGPNFQGDYISLCTCKRFMRTFLEPDDWIGKWVAGFSGVNAGRGRNALVYLMRVAHAFPSNADVWYSTEIPANTKQAKAAHCSIFGDLYEPVSEFIDKFDPCSYKPPLKDHKHYQNNGWYSDIDYTNRFGKTAALLFGDPGNSYIWDKPMYFYPESIGIGQRKKSLVEFLELLKSRENR